MVWYSSLNVPMFLLVSVTTIIIFCFWSFMYIENLLVETRTIGLATYFCPFAVTTLVSVFSVLRMMFLPFVYFGAVTLFRVLSSFLEISFIPLIPLLVLGLSSFF